MHQRYFSFMHIEYRITRLLRNTELIDGSFFESASSFKGFFGHDSTSSERL